MNIKFGQSGRDTIQGDIVFIVNIQDTFWAAAAIGITAFFAGGMMQLNKVFTPNPCMCGDNTELSKNLENSYTNEVSQNKSEQSEVNSEQLLQTPNLYAEQAKSSVQDFVDSISTSPARQTLLSLASSHYKVPVLAEFSASQTFLSQESYPPLLLEPSLELNLELSPQNSFFAVDVLGEFEQLSGQELNILNLNSGPLFSQASSDIKVNFRTAAKSPIQPQAISGKQYTPYWDEQNSTLLTEVLITAKSPNQPTNQFNFEDRSTPNGEIASTADQPTSQFNFEDKSASEERIASTPVQVIPQTSLTSKHNSNTVVVHSLSKESADVGEEASKIPEHRGVVGIILAGFSILLITKNKKRK